MTEKEHEFEQFVRTVLDESVEKMDGVSSARLAAMRRRAVSASNGRLPLWIPSALLGVAMATLLMIWVIPHQQLDDGFEVALEEIDMLASEADFELLEEMEFYQWLEKNSGRS